MNVLVAISKTDEQINNVLNGYAYALNGVGVNIIQWNGGTPLFEVFAQYKPDLIIASPDSINKAMVKVCKEFNPEVWVMFKDRGDIKTKIEGAKEIGVLCASDTEATEGEYYVPYGADIINFNPSKREKKYESVNSYVGRYNAKLEELFNGLGSSLRIYSPDAWNSLSYCGADNNKPAIYASSKNVILSNVKDTDFFNAIYSGANISNDIHACANFTDSVDGTHSYFHRANELLTKVGGHEELKLKLEQKMKEVEELYEKNRTSAG